MVTPDAKLVKAQRSLMEAYRQALRESDQLSMLNRAFVHHVVAISSRKAASYVRGRFPGTESLAQELAGFSTELGHDDAVAHLVSFARARAMVIIKWLVVGGGLTAIIGLVLYMMGGIVAGLGIPALLGIVFALLNNDGASELWDALKGPAAARAVLEKTLDQPEKDFFGLTKRRPPSRPTLLAAGIITVLLILAGILVILYLAA